MRKGTIIAIAAVAVVTVVAVVGIITMKPTPPTISKNAEEPKDEPEVNITINREQEALPVYEEIVDEETGETVKAEVQVNEPIEKKPSAPKEKPKSNESYTNPDAPPTYTKEQTEVKQEVKKAPQNKQEGQVYVEGFGYVNVGSETKVQEGTSTGDINKMVGIME